MSDQVLSDLIAEMETCLSETETLEPEYLEEWNAKLNAAIKVAERGPDWKTIVDRAHALNEKIQKHIGCLNYERDNMRQELEAQALGQRALKGYSQ